MYMLDARLKVQRGENVIKISDDAQGCYLCLSCQNVVNNAAYTLPTYYIYIYRARSAYRG